MTAMSERVRGAIAFVRATVGALPQTSRSLRRAPGFVAIATLSLGAALGMSTSVFALIDAMTHPVSPYRDVDQLFEVNVFGSAKISPSAADMREALAGIAGIEKLATVSWGYPDVEAGDQLSKVGVAQTHSGFFEMLGARPRLGRIPSPDEAQRGNVAVVSDNFWKLHYANRREIGDSHLSIGDNVYSIVGVMPTNATAPLNADVWRPDVEQSTGGFGIPFVQLKQGVRQKDVQAQLTAIMNRLTKVYALGPTDRPFAASLETLRPNPLALKDFHRAMFGAAICILLIACANVAALMLSRGTVRRRDYALRLALGATRADIAREVVFEVGALAVVGCVAGAIVATWTIGLMTRATPAELSWLGFVQPQWSARVLGMSAIAVFSAIAVAGGIPAWQASRTDPAGTLKDSSGGNTGRVATRFRWLVMAEVAMSMTLLVGASLMLKSVVLMGRCDFGTDTRRLLSAQIYLTNIRGTSTPEDFKRMNRESLASVRAIPGVESASLTVPCFFDHPMVTTDRTIEGGKAGTLPTCTNVTADYFRTLGYTIAEGRDFQDGDALGDGAVILDQKTAKVLFPHESPIGRTLKLGDLASHQPWMTIVGVVRDKYVGFNPYPERGTDSSLVMFVSAQDSSRDNHYIIARTAPGMRDAKIAVSRALFNALPRGAGIWVGPWTATYDRQLMEERFLALMFSLLGGVSLALGAAGLFSVVSYLASQRMREFAVRVALGASRENVAKLVMGDALLMALGGTAIGAGLGMWAGFMIWDKMYGVYPVDATALVAAEVTLLTVTMVACLVPALRATRADPVEVMRAT